MYENKSGEMPDRRVPDAPTGGRPDQQATDHRTAEHGTTDQRAADHGTAEQGTAHQRAADRGTADHRAAEHRAALFQELLERMAAEARKGGMSVDFDAYRAAGADPYRPVLLGSGSLNAQIGFFGRDPGRTEIQMGQPFIGKGGQLIRAELFQLTGSAPPPTPTIPQSIDAGRSFFWGNTVPFKPEGNKAWSVSVKRRFAPLISEVLVRCWAGFDLITLGTEAFQWFGLAEPTNRAALTEFWAREDRYQAKVTVHLNGKSIRLYPLPHPSPLNARWFKRFPELLRARLEELGL